MIKWLADTLLLSTVGFMAYMICLSINRKPMAQMVFYVALMLILLTTVQDLTPVISNMYQKAQAIGERVDKVQKSVDDFSQKAEGTNRIFQFGMPQK